MKKGVLFLSVIFIMMIVCSGCVPTMKPILEGTYNSYNEENNETFSKATFTIKEISKEEYEEAKGVNIFIDGSTHQKEEKRYLSIELYLYSVETEQYELATLTNLEYALGTGHGYDGTIYLKINDKVYKDENMSFMFYYSEDDRAHFTIFLGEFGTVTEVTFRADFRLE